MTISREITPAEMPGLSLRAKLGWVYYTKLRGYKYAELKNGGWIVYNRYSQVENSSSVPDDRKFRDWIEKKAEEAFKENPMDVLSASVAVGDVLTDDVVHAIENAVTADIEKRQETDSIKETPPSAEDAGSGRMTVGVDSLMRLVQVYDAFNRIRRVIFEIPGDGSKYNMSPIERCDSLMTVIHDVCGIPDTDKDGDMMARMLEDPDISAEDKVERLLNWEPYDKSGGDE